LSFKEAEKILKMRKEAGSGTLSRAASPEAELSGLVS
jgi:hypothetical protein